MIQRTDYQKLFSLINTVHSDCFNLCKGIMGKHLPVAGNIGIFCQSEKDYQNILKLQKEIVHPSNNPKQKYFTLKKPININTTPSYPSATYTHLYIRKYASDTPQLGDIDFILPEKNYQKFKQDVYDKKIPNAVVYDRPGWDMVELNDPEVNSIAYITTLTMAEKVRVRFD